MDDFFSEMRDYLPSFNNEISESSSGVSHSSSSSSIFAEALIPINVGRLPPYLAGSMVGSEMPELVDKIKTPFSNIEAMKDYLEFSKSDIQYRDRFWEVSEDTAIVNILSETGGDAGAFAAGGYANACAIKYLDKMVDTELTMNSREQLNMKIFEVKGSRLGIDPSTICGTGLARENVPLFMQDDICKRPLRGSRPTDLFGDDGPGLDGPILGPDSPSNNGGDSGSSGSSKDFWGDYSPYGPISENYKSESNEENIIPNDISENNPGIFEKWFKGASDTTTISNVESTCSSDPVSFWELLFGKPYDVSNTDQFESCPGSMLYEDPLSASGQFMQFLDCGGGSFFGECPRSE